MNSTIFFHLPWFVWGIASLIIATIYFFIWPKELVAQIPQWQVFILRWFHSVVWILLACSCFVRYFPQLGASQTADVLAKIALACYIIFMTIFAYQKFL